MHRVLCSTGTMLGRPNGRDFRLLLQLEKHLPCDGLELLFYDTWYDQTDALYHVVKQLSLPTPVFHAEKGICGDLVNPESFDDAVEKFRINCQFASAVGAEKMVFHLWDGWMKDDTIHTALSHYGLLSSIAAKSQISLTVENIVTAQHNPLHYCNRLLSLQPDVRFTYDTKIAAFHRQEEELYTPAQQPFSAHIAHLHINDYQGGYMDWAHFKTLHMGDGMVSFEPLFAHLHEINYTGDFTTEATSFDQTGTIHVEKLKNTLLTLRNSIQ